MWLYHICTVTLSVTITNSIMVEFKRLLIEHIASLQLKHSELRATITEMEDIYREISSSLERTQADGIWLEILNFKRDANQLIKRINALKFEVSKLG